MTLDEMKILAGKAVRAATDAGADTAEVSVTMNDRFSVTVRNGNIENLMESGSSRIGITVSVDRKKSSASSSDLSTESIRRIIGEAVELASFMDGDEYFGLPEEKELGAAGEELGLYDDETAGIPAEEKIKRARAVESSALAIDPRIISDGASASSGRYSVVYANSIGFCEGYRQTYSSTDISCAAEDSAASGENTGKKQSSYWYSASSSWRGLDEDESVAAKAVQRTLRKLGAAKPKTCEVPVIFDDVTAKSFLGSIASAVNGGNIYKRSSFLADRTGEKIASDLVTVIDDPLIPSLLGSRPFDSEGVRSRKNTVISGGKLISYLTSSYQARKLSLETTGNAGGTSNFYMAAGSDSLDDMISSIENGLFLISLSGPGANWSNGDFSQGGQGIWIKNGELSYPVNEFTVAGTFSGILSSISMIGDTIDWRGTIACPAFKVDGLTISGQ